MRPARAPLSANVWAVTTTSFLTDISSEMIVNLLPLYLFGVLGVRTTLVGLIEGVAESTSSLMKLLSGRLSDRLHARKGLALLGYGLSTAAKPFLIIASSWSWVLGVRFADRLGKGVRTAPRDALLADSVSPARRGLAFGLHRAGDTAGAVVGLAAASGVLHLMNRDGSGLTRSAFQAVVLISLVPAVLAIVVLALGARDVPASLAAESGLRLRSAGMDRRFRLFLFSVVFFTLGNSSDAFLILRTQTLGANVPQILSIMILFNLVYALASVPAGELSDRVDRRLVLTAGWGLYALVYMGFSLADAAWQAWGLMAAYGLYYGLTEGVAKAFVADLVPSDRRGAAYGLFHAAVGLAAFPASLLAGVLWQGVAGWAGFGPRAPFLVGALFALAAAALLWRAPMSQGTQNDSP
ncbi:MAG TPA: MFS transporter [Anaerolineales bacterium]|nr:MFS transporter [Anaerolineales bacterium]